MSYDYKKNEFTQKLPESFLRKCAELMVEPDELLRGFIGDFAGYYLNDNHDKNHGCFQSGSDKRDKAEDYALRRGYGHEIEEEMKEAEAVIQAEVITVLPELIKEWEHEAKEYECPVSELWCEMEGDIETKYKCITEEKYPLLLYVYFFEDNMRAFAKKTVEGVINSRV